MAILQMDDGSTIDTDLAGTSVGATSAPAGYLVSDYANNFAPSNLSPGASSMLDVLKYGFGRVVDYKVASLGAQNTPPQYSAPVTPATPYSGGLSMGTVLIFGAVAVGLVLALSDGK